MSRSARQLHVEALDALLNDRIVAIIRARDWELLAAVAALADGDAPTDLAMTDPARFRAWREAVTRWHLKGWTGVEASLPQIMRQSSSRETRQAVEEQGSDRC